jgi:hypothetical protein
MLLATSLLTVTEFLIILWPSPSLASKAFATLFPAVEALAATLLRHAQAFAAARSLPSGLEAVHTAAYKAATTLAGVMAYAFAQLGSPPCSDSVKDFMVSEDAMLLLVTNVAVVTQYKHKHKQLSAADEAATPGASSRSRSRYFGSSTTRSSSSSISSNTSNAAAGKGSAGSSAAVQAPAYHKQLLQALGLQDSQLGCMLESFPTIPAWTAVQGLLKAMAEVHETRACRRSGSDSRQARGLRPGQWQN